MVSDIVILPNCFKEKNVTSELIQVFKDIYDYPIFILNFENSNWLNYIKNIETNESISDSLRKAIQVFLKKIKNRIVLQESIEEEFLKTIDWLREIKIHEDIACVLVTSGDTTQCKKQKINLYQNIQDIILKDGILWDSIKVKGKEVRKNKLETKKILAPICRNTDKVILVDAYYNPSNTNIQRSLHLISENLGQSKNYRQEDKKILIHASSKSVTDLEQFKKDVQKKLAFFSDKYSIDYEFYLWNYIHDRSFLTDKMCLESTAGLEIRGDNSLGDNIITKWLLLDHNIAEEQLVKYDIYIDDEFENIEWKYST